MPNHDIEVPQVSVKVAGTVLAPDVISQLAECIVEDTTLIPSMSVLKFYVDPIYDAQLSLLDGGTFAVGSDIEVQMGHGRQLTTVFKGEIVSVEADFSAFEMSTMTVRSLDLGARLMRGRRSQAFLKVKDSDLVSRIAQEHGLVPGVIDATSVLREYVLQDNQTDWDFLQHLARRSNRRLMTRDGNRLCFEKFDHKPSDATVKYGESIRSFKPISGTAPQVKEVEVRGWDPLQKKPIVELARSIGAIQNSAGAPTGNKLASDLKSSKWGVTNQPVESGSDARNLAQSILDRVGSESLTAEMQVFGSATFKAGGTVSVEGVGTRFSGQYQVTSVTHTVSPESGWQSTLLMAGKSTGTLVEQLGDTYDLVPAHFGHGLVIGVVSNITDPENLGRVKVKFPVLGDQIESNWARVASDGAGKDRGNNFLPEVNDEVLVGFELGDVNRPYILGGLWSQVEQPIEQSSSLTQGGKVQRRHIKTRIGHVMTFDDSSDKQSVGIVTSKGNTFHIDDVNTKFTLKTAGGYMVEVDEKGRSITISDNSQNKVEIKTPNITMKCTGNISIEATGNVNIKGTAGVKIESAASAIFEGTGMATVKSSGILTVQGSLVKIN